MIKELRRALRDFCDGFKPAKFDRVPFREVTDGSAFWWKGRIYIKENSDFIFDREPVPRPFDENEIVEV